MSLDNLKRSCRIAPAIYFEEAILRSLCGTNAPVMIRVCNFRGGASKLTITSMEGRIHINYIIFLWEEYYGKITISNFT